MKKFEYLRVASYINKKEWVVNYLGNELPADYQDAIFAELGINGWELTSTSTYIDGDIVNTALIPIRADTTVGVSNTSGEVYYFKREVQSEGEYSKEFKKQIDYIRNISNSAHEKIEKEIQNSLNSEKYVDDVKNTIISKGFEEGKTIIDVDYSFYKKEEKVQIDKSLFGKESKKMNVIDMRVDLVIYENGINYKYFEKFENSTWSKYDDLDISFDEEAVASFRKKLNL